MQKSIIRSSTYGIGSMLLMFGAYFLVLTLLSGWSFALSQFSAYRYFILSLSVGFGIQIALYQYIKILVHDGRGMGKMVGASGATSAAAMVSCCAHYLVNLLPVLGVTGLVTFVAQYQVNFFWVGILLNIAGIAYMAKRISTIIQKS